MNGRWASEGRKVVYAAGSIALALLKNMVRRQGAGFNHDFKIVVIEVPDDMTVTVIEPSELINSWRDFRDYSICQAIGNPWYDGQLSCILKVPSAVITGSANYVINTMHPDFKRVKIIGVTDLVPDERIEQLLKGYNKP